MLITLCEQVDKLSENFKKNKNCKKMNLSALKNITTEIKKNTLDRIKSRSDDAEKLISDQEYRIGEITQLEDEEKKEFKIMRIA